MAKVNRVSHVVLNVSDPEASAKWYSEALGMELMNYSSEVQMAFLSFGTLDHDIALVKAPEGVETGSPGLSHTALSIEGGPEELKEIHERVKKHRCQNRDDSGPWIDQEFLLPRP